MPKHLEYVDPLRVSWRIIFDELFVSIIHSESMSCTKAICLLSAYLHGHICCTTYRTVTERLSHLFPSD